MTFTISLFHLPLVIMGIISFIFTVQQVTSNERDPFYGLGVFMPTIGFLFLTGLYYGAYYWFKFTA